MMIALTLLAQSRTCQTRSSARRSDIGASIKVRDNDKNNNNNLSIEKTMTRVGEVSTNGLPLDSPPAYSPPPAYSTPLPPLYSKLPGIKARPLSQHTYTEEALHFSRPPSSVLAEDGKWYFNIETRPGRRRKRGEWIRRPGACAMLMAVISDTAGKPLLSIYALQGRWLLRSKEEELEIKATPGGLAIDGGARNISVSDGEMVAEGQVLGTLDVGSQSVSGSEVGC